MGIVALDGDMEHTIDVQKTIEDVKEILNTKQSIDSTDKRIKELKARGVQMKAKTFLDNSKRSSIGV